MPSKKIFISVIITLVLYACTNSVNDTNEKAGIKTIIPEKKTEVFKAPDTTLLKDDDWGNMVKYGMRLVKNTAYYLGPDGIVSKNLGNKMNCTNCHLDAGTRPFGLNFFYSHANYPQYRARENKILSLADRVNNCIERPHSGEPLKLDSKEMTAIISYIKWIGEKYDKEKHEGYDLKYIEYGSLTADPKRGARVYEIHCKSCHQPDGQGQMTLDKVTYAYPPLWGEKAYQEGSSMQRVIKAASFIKYNMPNLKTNYETPLLSDQEALDVAAFINDGSIHPRPKSKYVSYENINTKPMDYFKGPYIDTFSEKQHTFGPWDEIEKYYSLKGLKINK